MGGDFGRRRLADGNFAEDRPNSMNSIFRERYRMETFSSSAYRSVTSPDLLTLALQVLEKNGGGTTGLEPAAFAATGARELVLQQLGTMRGVPKYPQVAQGHSPFWVELWVGKMAAANFYPTAHAPSRR
jgi:hypothetical protein